MAAISQTTISDVFSRKKMYKFRFVLRGLINNIPALVQIMAWRRPGAKPLSEPMMVNSLMHIYVTGPQWVDDGHREATFPISKGHYIMQQWEYHVKQVSFRASNSPAITWDQSVWVCCHNVLAYRGRDCCLHVPSCILTTNSSRTGLNPLNQETNGSLTWAYLFNTLRSRQNCPAASHFMCSKGRRVTP